MRDGEEGKEMGGEVGVVRREGEGREEGRRGEGEG